MSSSSILLPALTDVLLFTQRRAFQSEVICPIIHLAGYITLFLWKSVLHHSQEQKMFKAVILCCWEMWYISPGHPVDIHQWMPSVMKPQQQGHWLCVCLCLGVYVQHHVWTRKCNGHRDECSSLKMAEWNLISCELVMIWHWCQRDVFTICALECVFLKPNEGDRSVYIN